MGKFGHLRVKMLGEYRIGADSGGRDKLGSTFLNTSGGLIYASVSSVDEAVKKLVGNDLE